MKMSSIKHQAVYIIISLRPTIKCFISPDISRITQTMSHKRQEPRDVVVHQKMQISPQRPRRGSCSHHYAGRGASAGLSWSVRGSLKHWRRVKNSPSVLFQYFMREVVGRELELLCERLQDWEAEEPDYNTLRVTVDLIWSTVDLLWLWGQSWPNG